jgi:hypothetical protein
MSHNHEVPIIDQKGYTRDKIKLKRLSEPIGDDYKKLGKAKGKGVDHCAFIAMKHVENFKEKVFGYRVEHVWDNLHDKEDVDKFLQKEIDGDIEVVFYEKNN